jgi:hypothetical protein
MTLSVPLERKMSDADLLNIRGRSSEKSVEGPQRMLGQSEDRVGAEDKTRFGDGKIGRESSGKSGLLVWTTEGPEKRGLNFEGWAIWFGEDYNLGRKPFPEKWIE